MSTTDETTVPTPEDAEAALAQLEEAVVAGDDVPVTAVIEAREKVSIARLFRQGQEARAEKKRLQGVAERRDAAKREVAELLGDNEVHINAVAEKAKQALLDLLKVIEDSNAEIRTAERIYNTAGVLAWNVNGMTSPEESTDYPEFDLKNFAGGYGADVKYIRVGGQSFYVENPATRYLALVRSVAKESRMRMDSGKDVADLIGGA